MFRRFRKNIKCFFVVRGIVCGDLGFDLYFALNVRVVGSDQAIPAIYDCNSKGYYDTVYIIFDIMYLFASFSNRENIFYFFINIIHSLLGAHFCTMD